MAIAKDGVFVAPSTDLKTLDELNSNRIPSGLYNCTEEVTISYKDEHGATNTLTSNLWTVLCTSSNNASNVTCFTQLWICSACQTNDVFIRTALLTRDGYTEFSKLVDLATLGERAVLNTADEPVQVIVSNTQPEAEAGITKIWINTAS